MTTIDQSPSQDSIGVAGSKFSSVPEWIWDSDLSDGAVRLYCALVSYVRGREGVAYPSRATLARRCRCSVDKIDRLLKELHEYGAIDIKRRPVKNEKTDPETGETKKTTRHLSSMYFVFADSPELADIRGSRTGAARWPHERGQGVAAPTRPKEEPPFESESLKGGSFPQGHSETCKDCDDGWIWQGEQVVACPNAR